ncbi:homeobox protein onecut-like [Stylophora pistillata]|uniref:One cut domain family member n=1 Tax=Stylophora pistillata TaxID=50429 RepID=A0A2B4RVY6_STYPI|nr:homeobox protein onecut-like [Stylophora pistillata]PFX20989.1 Hepatocyte nuclear factor 6 [Stylophora pistillata]
MSSDEIRASNSISSLSNLVDTPNDSDVDELDPLALGASEEVNTSTNVETLQPEVLGQQRKTPLNSPYMYNETSNTATEMNLNGKRNSKDSKSDDFANLDSDMGNGNENGTSPNVTDTIISTTVVSEGISLDSARGIVVMEQVALEQINELIASASRIQDDSSTNNETFEDSRVRTHFRSENQNSDSSSTELGITRKNAQQKSLDSSADASLSEEFDLSRFENLDTKKIAEALTNELKKYSIPQAVFARKVLNRSQGTLSDVLRKPKPWNELRGGREIFRKMKEWLDLPEVKRIPQLRAEAALELDAKARSEEESGPPKKKTRLYFTDSQKRALFAIFKETKKPSKEMQNALAEELGLERETVANFFMNARRRHPEL